MRSSAAASWILGFGLIAFLSFSGGGYEVTLFGQVGLFGWSLLILGSVLRLFPTSRLTLHAWIGIALLVSLLAWACLGLYVDREHRQDSRRDRKALNIRCVHFAGRS